MPDFNLGFPEIVVLVILAVIIFGPEKLPDLARKTARVVAYVRGIANDARGQLTEQLGPEFSDLRPAALVQNLLGEENLNDVKTVVADTKQTLVETGGTIHDAAKTVADEGRSFAAAGEAVTHVGVDTETGDPGLLAPAASAPRRPAPFDPEST